MPDNNIPNLSLLQDGWMISYEGKFAGPFSNVDQIDVQQVATDLGCEEKSVLRMLLRIRSRMGKEEDNSEGFHEADLTFGQLDKVNPAFDVLNLNPHPQLCTVIPQPCRILDKHGEIEEKIVPVLVLSNKKVYPVNEQTFRQFGICHFGQPEPPPVRWSQEGFHAWKYGDLKVNKQDVFNRIKEKFEYYVECVETGMYYFIPLWLMGTYFHRLMNTFPLTALTGSKSSGKSKILKMGYLLAFNGKWSVSMTESRMFRVAEAQASSMFLDEMEGMMDPERKQYLRSLLNSSYEKGATADRTDKNTGKGEEFMVYGPRMMGGIQGFEDVLESRAIVFIMLRTVTEKANREPQLDVALPEWQSIRDDMYTLMMTEWREVKKIYDSMEASGELYGLKGRDWQLWRPIFALAKWLDDPYVTAHIIKLAKIKAAYRKEKDQWEMAEIVLLKSLKKHLLEDGWQSLSIIKTDMEEEYGEDIPRWFSNRYVDKLLTRLGWQEKRKKRNSKEYKINRTEVED
ncbi:MAG: hypothetical protein ABID61_02335, partial [Candidatus Micrarchaeota archaeon]